MDQLITPPMCTIRAKNKSRNIHLIYPAKYPLPNQGSNL